VHGDALDKLLSTGVRPDQSTNTQRGARFVHALFGASAVIMSVNGAASDVRFVLQNEDCGAAILLPTLDERRADARAGVAPMAFVVPPDACPSFRWSSEGVALFADPSDSSTICRGGTEGGLLECSTVGIQVCTSTGGACAPAPVVEGVPYTGAYAYSRCIVCASDAECATPACAPHPCCAERVRHWYRYANSALVYVPQQIGGQALIDTLAIAHQSKK